MTISCPKIVPQYSSAIVHRVHTIPNAKQLHRMVQGDLKQYGATTLSIGILLFSSIARLIEEGMVALNIVQ